MEIHRSAMIAPLAAALLRAAAGLAAAPAWTISAPVWNSKEGSHSRAQPRISLAGVTSSSRSHKSLDR
jgi:hypothetical protein